jgi:hypothetical protein
MPYCAKRVRYPACIPKYQVCICREGDIHIIPMRDNSVYPSLSLLYTLLLETPALSRVPPRALVQPYGIR